jgi:arginyl-tRNA synthetase
LIHPKERELIKQISMLDMALLEAGEFLSPKEVARYAYGIASTFNEFYETVPVNNEKNADLRAARLALVEAFSIILRGSLDLIGIPCPERL